MTTIGQKINKGRLILIECISPVDAFNGRNETASLSNVCKLIGHETLSISVKSVSDFKETCKYVSSMDKYQDNENTKSLFIHLSTHGSSSGLCFGADEVRWEDLFEYVEPICKMTYPGQKIFSISSCYATKQKLTSKITREHMNSEDFSPPKYIFVPSDDSISWDNAVVGWTILFHQLPQMSVEEKQKVKDLLKAISKLGIGKFRYYRWDDTLNSYKIYSANG